MGALSNQRWIFARRPQGADINGCFETDTARVPDLAEGGYLVRNLYIAMDPSARTWMNGGPNYRDPLVPGQVMEGTTVGEVLESRNDGFQRGDLVMGIHGWEQYTIGREGFFASQVLPRLEGIPPSWFLGVLGPTGLTAYFAMTDKLQPKAGETILISAAAGAVGSIAGQICKQMGARVIGLAGSDEKCRWLLEQCGFDQVVDYRSRKNDLAAALREAAPEGIDGYFDNVGGAIFDAAVEAMNDHGRITLCGFISGYQSESGNPSPPVNSMWQFLLKRMTMNAFLLTEYTDRFEEGLAQLGKLMGEGKLVHREHIIEGLENAPDALAMLFDGSNSGKLLVKV